MSLRFSSFRDIGRRTTSFRSHEATDGNSDEEVAYNTMVWRRYTERDSSQYLPKRIVDPL